MTRILITGSRDWECRPLAQRVVDRLLAKYGDDLTLVIGGCASGIDINFEILAKFARVDCEIHPAKWFDFDAPNCVIKKDSRGRDYNANAGPQRNKEMVDSGIDYCIACHQNLRESKGTKNCVSLCLKAGIPVYLIDSEDGEPRRIKSLEEA